MKRRTENRVENVGSGIGYATLSGLLPLDVEARQEWSSPAQVSNARWEGAHRTHRRGLT